MKRAGVLFVGTLVALALPIAPAFAPCHVIEFSPTAYTIGEGAGKVTLTVTNNGGAQNQDQMVDYKTVDGTAKAPMDYTARSGTITFAVGAPDQVTIDIPIRNDTVDEPAERFGVKLSNVRPPSSCAPPPGITGDTATVTIGDNDKPKPKPAPSPSRTQASSPSPTPKKPASPSPTPTRTTSPSASPSPSPSPTSTLTTVAAPDAVSDGGLPGGAIAGIVGGVIVLGGGAALLVRRRFLS